jgi:hypothetical protein
MKITLPKQDIVLAPYLNLGSILWIEQHSVCGLDRPHIGSDGHNLAPSEPASDGYGRRDQDATAAASLTRLIVGRNQHSIMQHPDRQRTLIQAAGVFDAALVGHHSITTPALHDRADDQHESHYPCNGCRYDRDATGAKIATSIEDLGLGILQLGIRELLHVGDLALLDAVGMNLVDQRLN